MYYDVIGQCLIFYVFIENKSNKDIVFCFVQEGLVNVFYWIDGKFGYVFLVGIDKGELVCIVMVVYVQFSDKD